MLRIVLPEKAEAVIRFRAAPELQARIEELAGKSTEGKLTEADAARRFRQHRDDARPQHGALDPFVVVLDKHAAGP